MRNVTICTFGKTQSHGNNLKWTNHVHHDIILNQSKTFTDIIYATKKSRVESPDEIFGYQEFKKCFQKVRRGSRLYGDNELKYLFLYCKSC